MPSAIRNFLTHLVGLAVFLWRAVNRGLPSLWRTVSVVVVLVGGSLVAAIGFAVDLPLWLGALLVLLVLFLITGEGAYRLHQSDRTQLRDAEAKVEALEAEKVELEENSPRLAFGRAEIPQHSVVYDLHMGDSEPFQERGRVIRVPVMNAQGAGEARQVHARLTFLPDDPSGAFSPVQSIQGEWEGSDGIETEVNLPGNGSPRYLAVIFVRDGPYPHGFAWTEASRAVGLAGYGIATDRIDIKVEIMASGPMKPVVSDTLTVECRARSMLIADWTDIGDLGTNHVGWKSGYNA